MKPKILFTAIALTGLLAGVATSLLHSKKHAQTYIDPTGIRATVLNPAKPLQPFEMADANGRRFDNRRLRGGWSFLFFGYTYCPDVCPTSLSAMSSAVDLIGQRNAPRPQVYFVSIDPERDTPEHLARYVPYFNADFLGVAGAPESLEKLTRQLGVLYVKVENESDAGYLMDHTASTYLINPEGKLQALFAPPHDPTVMVEDYALIAERYE